MSLPVFASFDIPAAAIALAAALTLFCFKAGVIRTLSLCARAGVVLRLAGIPW